MKTKTEVQIEKGCRIKKSKLKRKIKLQIEKAKKDPIEQGNKHPNRKGI